MDTPKCSALTMEAVEGVRRKLDKLRARLAERTRRETAEQRKQEKDHGAGYPEESSDGRTGFEEGS